MTTVGADRDWVAAAALGRATRAVVDLDVVAGNVRAIGRRLARGARLMAVVKGDGYGHGAVAVARSALAAGASALGVATVGEGAALRSAGIGAPILLLSAIDPAEAGAAVAHRLDLTVGTLELLAAIAEAARAGGLAEPPGVHVKVDSGMRRYGAERELAVVLAARVAADACLRLTGLSTHFANADEADEAVTQDQARCFERVVADLAAVGIEPELLHAANSAATLRSERYHYRLVRVGIALYGLAPSAAVVLPAELRPALTVTSRLTRVIGLEPGDGVGYGMTYRAARRERVAVVPIGYADGYRRGLSDRGWMGFRGGRAPLRGRVSMDQAVIGLDDGVAAAVGDEVVVIGDGRDGGPTVAELAEELGTISYEVVVGISGRVPRLYRSGGEVMGGVTGLR